MGLIKAIVGATGGVLADQWREYFYCESLDKDILVAKGQKRTSDRRSSNVRGEDNIISNGSIIAVNDGQCMIIVEQGKVVDLSAEPGEFVYDVSTEPTIFFGGLGEGVKRSFANIGKRFTFGGDTAKDQRVYYFNTKEILGNKYGTVNPVPFRVVDTNINLDIDISIRCNGEYSYKIIDPILFYTNVTGNVADVYNRNEIDSMLRTELLTALQPAFAKISALGIRYSALPGHTTELANALNEVLSEKWTELRGIRVASFGVNSVTASKEDEDLIKQLQKSAVMRDPTMAGAALVGAQADAMRAAASNEGGAMMGFMGLGMAQGIGGGMNAANLYQMGQQNPNAPYGPQGGQYPPPQGQYPQQQGPQYPPPQGQYPQQQGPQYPPPQGQYPQQGGYAPQGGAAGVAPVPPVAPVEGWSCGTCGKAGNTGKFCMECGKQRPAGAPVYACDKCGWQPSNPQNPPKFCPECGDVFDEADRK